MQAPRLYTVLIGLMLLAALLPLTYASGGGCTCGCSDAATCNAALSCQKPTGTTYCTTVTLTSNVVLVSGDFISSPANFTGQSQTFDCAGHTISGAGAGTSTYGFYVNGKSTNTIQNCNIANFSYGIGVTTSSSFNVINNNVSSTTQALYFSSDSSLNVTGNRFAGSIAFLDNGGNALSDTITNNIFNGSVVNSGGNSTLNTSKTAGTAINGEPNRGGNLWLNAGTGFSETCTDANIDGICDSAYAINGASETDYLPLSVYNCYCDIGNNSCLNQLNKGYCAITYLTGGGVVNYTFVNAPTNFTNKTFDCNGYTVSGRANNATTPYGVYIPFNSVSAGATIRDCILANFTNTDSSGAAIYLSINTTNMTLLNNTLRQNGIGLYLNFSNKGTVYNNTIFNNTAAGILVRSSSNITFYNNKINNTFNANITYPGLQLYTAVTNGHTFTSSAPGGVAWTNPTFANSSDASFATSALTAVTKNTTFLNVTNFQFNIPSGINTTIITGIVVQIDKKANVTGNITDANVSIMRNGSFVAGLVDHRNATTWPTSTVTAVYGNSTDLWGLAWGPADINATGFGVAIKAVSTGTAIASVDYIRVTVYYNMSTTANNFWNSSSTSSVNIIGGPNSDGNYWTNYTLGGYSDSCTDTTPRDGLCDSSYSPDANNTDNFPLAIYNCYCNTTSGDCTSDGNNLACTNTYLTQSGSTSDNWFFAPSTNFGTGKVFDCQGNSITANNVSTGAYGITLSANNNFTIKNCIFHDWDGVYGGMYIYRVTNGLFSNLTFYNNTHGIAYSGNNGDNNLVFNQINSSGNNYDGMKIGESSYSLAASTIANSTFSNNGNDGLNIVQGQRINITNVNASFNNYSGIDFVGLTSDFVITSSNFSFNNESGINATPSNGYNGITYTGVSAQENKLFDYLFDANYCNNSNTNITGSGGNKISFYTGSVSLSNLVLSELILCNSNNSALRNVTISASSSLFNNGLFIISSNNTSVNNVTSSQNLFGLYADAVNNMVVNGSTFSNNGANGISITSANGVSTNLNITNSSANNNNASGAYISQATNTIMANLNATNNTNAGIRVSNSTTTSISNVNASNNWWGVLFENPYAGSSGGGGSGCFLPGTLVSTLYGQKPIENIAANDTVLSFNSEGLASSKVQKIYQVHRDYYYVIHTSGAQVKVTAEHPFYVGNNSFAIVSDLKLGQTVYLLQDGAMVPQQITMISRVDQPTFAYNLFVNDPHTFFANGFAVHNKGSGGGLGG